jgi:hypothetical protein
LRDHDLPVITAFEGDLANIHHSIEAGPPLDRESCRFSRMSRLSRFRF